MALDKSNIKAVYRYKQVSPEVAQVKTQAVLRILSDALKKNRRVIDETDCKHQACAGR
jgi:hypothetical protein